MSAVLESVPAHFEPMTEARLDEVMAIEQQAYEHPWSRGNFVDSLHAGYHGLLACSQDQVVGYFVAMEGVEEVHLLNIAVAPGRQGQGWALLLLEALTLWARARRAQWLWLEVRRSNLRAQRIYERYGFRHVGERRNYYPARHGQREDAIVMSLAL